VQNAYKPSMSRIPILALKSKDEEIQPKEDSILSPKSTTSTNQLPQKRHAFNPAKISEVQRPKSTLRSLDKKE